MTNRDRFAKAVDRLQHERAVLLGAIERMSQIQLNFQPSRHSWSIGQVAHHVGLAETIWHGYIRAVLKKGNREDGATVRVSLQEVPFSSRIVPDFILNSPFVLAPLSIMVNFLPKPIHSMLFAVPIFKMEAGSRFQPKVGLARNQIRRFLEDTRRTTLQLIEPFADWDLSLFRILHPLVGDQDVYGVLALVANHDQRHTSQIESIKKAPDFPPGVSAAGV
jgi:hypothetical protein